MIYRIAILLREKAGEITTTDEGELNALHYRCELNVLCRVVKKLNNLISSVVIKRFMLIEFSEES